MRRIVWILCLLTLLPVATITAQELPPVNPSQLGGDILTAGSTAMAPFVENIAAGFRQAGYAGTVAVDRVDTGAAIERLCLGELDIANAARQITPEELNACVATGRNPIAFRVATDATVVIVNSQNTYALNLSSAELQTLFSTALSWSDVRSEWPGQPVNRYLPDPATDTFTFFVNMLFAGNTSIVRASVGSQFVPDFTSLIQRVAGDPNGVGFLPASVVNSQPGVVNVSSIDGVGPNADSVVNSSYLLSRPLLLYANSAVMQQQSQVSGFINYAITNANTFATQVGFYSAGPANLATSAGAWFTVMGGATTEAAQPQTPPDMPAETMPEVAPAPEVVDAAPAEPVEPVQNILPWLVDARSDLELIAIEIFGISRPEGWSGSLDIADPQLALLVRLDLELAAAVSVGETVRPLGWFGATPGSAYNIVRDIRHDLEILADAIYGAGGRPSGWAGSPEAIFLCNRATQTLVNLLERGGLLFISVDESAANYCDQVELQIAQYTEANLLSAPIDQPIFFVQAQAAAAGSGSIDTDFAVSFLDRGATASSGVIPNGTAITALGRSPAQFSNMTLVQGEGFLLFVDWRDTYLTEEQFRALPNVDTLNLQSFCDTNWCR